jgi:hypothetical protein
LTAGGEADRRPRDGLSGVARRGEVRLWFTLIAMSTFSVIVGAIVDVRQQLVTGVFTLTAGWGAVRLTSRNNERQRAGDRAAAANAEIKQIAQELYVSVGALHVALKAHIPAHNSWTPKLTTIGMSVLEYAAGKSRSGHYVGVAEGARVVLASTQQEKDAALALLAPLQRVLAATAQAALLPSGEVRQAALELSQAASACAVAYGRDNLWQSGKAQKARGDADTALYAALASMLEVVNAQLHPAEEPRRRWWSRRRPITLTAPAAVEAAGPAPLAGGPANAKLPAGTVRALPAAGREGR